jgi:hypothetical protein
MPDDLDFNNLTQRQALGVLQEGTHRWLTPEAGAGILKAFGITNVAPWKERANTKNPKGLFVDGVPPNTVVRGYPSHFVAEVIALQLRLSYAEKLGRGSQQMACVAAIDRYLQEQEGAVANA